MPRGVVPTQRFFTLDEANELLPTVREVLPALRNALHQHRFAKDQVSDLERMWDEHGGPPPESPENTDHDEYMRLKAAQVVKEREAMDALTRLVELGIQVKDPTIGLVDFPAHRKGETVLLCWQEGEPEVQTWHTLDGGFAGRRPVSEF